VTSPAERSYGASKSRLVEVTTDSRIKLTPALQTGGFQALLEYLAKSAKYLTPSMLGAIDGIAEEWRTKGLTVTT
jgi:hypothetical protein